MKEPLGIFLLRLAMLVAFGVAMSAAAPRLWFAATHPGVMLPPGLGSYTAFSDPTARSYRLNGKTYVYTSNRAAFYSGPSVSWTGAGSVSGGE